MYVLSLKGGDSVNKMEIVVKNVVFLIQLKVYTFSAKFIAECEYGIFSSQESILFEL